MTLLALGNGAPDLVAAVAFVRAGKYRVALSGLLGEITFPRRLPPAFHPEPTLSLPLGPGL